MKENCGFRIGVDGLGTEERWRGGGCGILGMEKRAPRPLVGAFSFLGRPIKTGTAVHRRARRYEDGHGMPCPYGGRRGNGHGSERRVEGGAAQTGTAWKDGHGVPCPYGL